MDFERLATWLEPEREVPDAGSARIEGGGSHSYTISFS